MIVKARLCAGAVCPATTTGCTAGGPLRPVRLLAVHAEVGAGLLESMIFLQLEMLCLAGCGLALLQFL